MLTLKRFRATSFRSVHDSGWVEAGAVTALIGTNESGKTNLLIPLWKLNPAKDGEIDPIADYPRAEYNEMRAETESRIFICAEFETDTELRTKLAAITRMPANSFDLIHVSRSFDGKRHVAFPKTAPPRTAPKAELVEALTAAVAAVANEKTSKKEDALKTAMGAALAETAKHVGGLGVQVDATEIALVRKMLGAVNVGEPIENSTLVPRWRVLGTTLAELEAGISLPPPESVAEAVDAVIESLPVFVYYSNYGNLDSEIYLPHVIENMKRHSLGPKDAGKVRTLKVLFEYVRLSPE